MKIRTTPFGYEKRNGEIVPNSTEVQTILRIFALYEQRESLLRIAQRLQDEGIPYYKGKATWNMSCVSRILRNEIYLGNKKHPKLLEPELFYRIQRIYKEKIDKYVVPAANPIRILWEKLICHECGHRITLIGGKLVKMGIVQLRCTNPDCDNGLDITIAELHRQIWEAMARPTDTMSVPADQEYQPSTEVIRIRNEIDRQIQSPSHPDEAKRLILQGIEARYECIRDKAPPPKLIYEENNRPAGNDWKLFGRAVSLISIGKDHAIHVQYTKENVPPGRV